MIDPNIINTISVGELPSAPFNLTDKIPHEIGTELKNGTIQQLTDFISSIINVNGGVGFRAVSVTDGQTLPTTIKQEFILVGKGTYYNISGGSTIAVTEELNALVSNGSFWFIGVEIPINVELAGITQFLREGFLTTAPSEDAIFKALALKQNIPTKDIFNIFKFIQKGFNNNNLNTNEIGDIFCGWKNDGTIRYTEALYLGGLLNNSDNFTPLVQTQI